MLILTIKKKMNVFAIMKNIFLMSLCFFASQSFAASVTSVKYNTIQNDEIELVFSLSENISIQPIVKTSIEPAQINITFAADSFDENLAFTEIAHAGVNSVEINKTAGNVVAAIHLDALSVFDVSQVDNTFSIVLNKGVANTAVTKITPVGGDFINNIESIDFRKNKDDEAQLIINLADSMVAVDVRDRLEQLFVEFHNTAIIEDLLYKLDVTDFGTLVQGIETFKDGRNARLVVDIDGEYEFEHQQLNNVFTLSVSKKAETPGYLEDADDFSGRAISLNFQDISVRTVLQIIADYNGFNLVTSDTVSGNITLRLDGVPWDQALDIILKVKGLDKRMDGNILMVAPSDELAAREARELQAKQQVEELAPLYSEYVQINYAKALEFANLIKNEDTSILSERGSVSRARS